MFPTKFSRSLTKFSAREENQSNDEIDEKANKD